MQYIWNKNVTKSLERVEGYMFKFDLGQDIGIDLGTATVIAYVKGKGLF